MSALCRKIILVILIHAKKTISALCGKLSNTDPYAHFNDLHVYFVALFPLSVVNSARPRHGYNRVKTDVSTLHNVCEMLAEEASY